MVPYFTVSFTLLTLMENAHKADHHHWQHSRGREFLDHQTNRCTEPAQRVVRYHCIYSVRWYTTYRQKGTCFWDCQLDFLVTGKLCSRRKPSLVDSTCAS